MRTQVKTVSGAQRACLPNGRSVLSGLLIPAAIAAAPVVGQAQTIPPNVLPENK